jgi:uncharacterized protein (UPF0276 family)
VPRAEPVPAAEESRAAESPAGQPHALTGVGLGLRWDFLDDLLERLDTRRISRSDIPFFEVSPENYMRRGGHIVEALDQVAQHFPLISHGLQMSIGGTDAYADDYFRQLRAFVERVHTPWHSDHLCFCGTDGRTLHDLLPLPQTEAAALNAAARVREAQDRLGLPMAVENISFYLHLGKPEMQEAEFVAKVLDEADCKLLLDVNNVYVNSLNHGFDAIEWLEQVDMDRVVQLHVAGHEYRQEDGLTIDSHGAPVLHPVYEMLTWVIARKGPVAVILERDNNVPELDELLEERARLDVAYQRGLALYEEERK